MGVVEQEQARAFGRKDNRIVHGTCVAQGTDAPSFGGKIRRSLIGADRLAATRCSDEPGGEGAAQLRDDKVRFLQAWTGTRVSGAQTSAQQRGTKIALTGERDRIPLRACSRSRRCTL